MVTDQTKRELQNLIRSRIRQYPIETISREAKLPTVDVIRFMDGGEELADNETAAKLAIANYALAAENQKTGTDADNCECPGCQLRRSLIGKGVIIHQVKLSTEKSAEPKNETAEGLYWNSVPRWFTPVCGVVAVLLSVAAVAIAIRGYS